MRIKRRDSILIFLSLPKQKGKKKSLPHCRRRGSCGRSRSGASSVRRRLHGSPILPSPRPPSPQALHRRCHLPAGLFVSLSLLFSIFVWLPRKRWKVKPKPRKDKRKTFETESKDHTFCFT